MEKFKKIFSAMLAAMTVLAGAPIRAETYEINSEPQLSDTSQVQPPGNPIGDFLENTLDTLKEVLLPEAHAAEDDIASGGSGGVTWRIDAEGTLTLSPTNGTSGTMESLNGNFSGSPWYSYKTKIKKAVAEPGTALGENAAYLFYNCTNLSELDLNNLDVSNVTNMYGMFYNCNSLTSLDGLADWQTGSVTDMNSMFYDCYKLTSLDALAEWNTGSVTRMSNMFNGCTVLTSLEPLANWQTGNVTNMLHMFYCCYKLTSLKGLANWQTGNVTNMEGMFLACENLVSLDGLAKWDTGSVTNMESLFEGCISLTSLDGLADWDTGSVTNMACMFQYCNNLTTLEGLANWQTGNVTNMEEMFSSCNSLTSLDGLADWDTGSVTGVRYVFQNCSSLTSLEPLAGWETESVRYMSHMFDGCSSLTSLDGLTDWDTGSVTNMSYMFNKCSSLTSLDGLAEWNTGNVTDMEDMFYGCSSLTSLDGLADWEMGNVTDMNSMFSKCSSLTSLDGLADWETGNVKYTYYMFAGCNSLTSIDDLVDWQTGNVVNLDYMFQDCNKVKSADFSNWTVLTADYSSDTYKVTHMLSGCSSLSEITISTRTSLKGSDLPGPKANDVCTGNWTYGDPYNHTPKEVLTNRKFCTGPRKAGTWYWEKRGERPPQHYVSNSDNIFVPEYIENDDGSTSLKQLPEEVFTEDGYWQQQDDNTWVYTFYVIDASVQWYVWEENVPAGYTSSATMENPIIIENGSTVLTIVNTSEDVPKEFGSLSVQKTLIDNTGEQGTQERSFPFKITILDDTNTPLSGVEVFDGTTFKDGVAYISVTANETITIDSIPAGYHYTVEELPNDKYIQEITNNTGVIQTTSGSGLVVATNTRIDEPDRPAEDLTLRKTVTGNVETDESFRFVVSFNNLEADTEYTSGQGSFISDSEGNADVDVSLKDGEEITFADLPTGAQYRILEEAGDYVSSYTVKDANNLGMINQSSDTNETENEELSTFTEVVDAGEDVTVEFTNKIVKTQNITISKAVLDAEGTPLSDGTRYEFTVKFSNTEPGTEIMSDLGKLRTDDNGQVSASFYLANGEQVKFEGIPVGAQYRFTEAENNAVASYKITDTLENDKTETVSNANEAPKQELSTSIETVDNAEDTTVAFTNTISNGSLTIHKKNSNGDSLMGAEFKLTNSDGEVFEPTQTATNAEGIIQWEELPLGSYTLTETKAPAGVVLMKEPMTIEITSETPDVEISITDNSAIYLDAGGKGLIAWMTVSSAAYLLTEKRKKKNYGV